MMKWYVGLGNPGTQYQYTRHNIGFMAIDAFAEKWNISVKPGKGKVMIGEGMVGGQKVYLLKPQTYMNLSGEAVRAFMDFYKADLADMMIIYDDLDTPFGKIRLRYQGSSGGQNGIKSIVQHIGTQSFDRIRVGISRPPHPEMNVADYVLSPFTKEDQRQLPQILSKVVDAMEYRLDHTFEQTMAKFNG